MKIMRFFHEGYLYQIYREGPYPILLEFGRNCKIMVSKDLGLDH
jgi:hypothetical protein